jgi:hypothetical protein
VKSLATGCTATLGISVPNCACPNEPVISVTYPENSCGLTAIPLSSSWTNSPSATWSSSGTGSFSSTSGASPFINTYTPSTADTTNGSVTLTLTTPDPDGAGPCTAVAKIITINLMSGGLPTPVISASQANYCAGDTVSLTTNSTLPLTWTGPHGYTSDSSVVWIPDATQGFSGYYTATISGNGCSSTNDVFNLWVAAPPSLVVSTTPLDEVCEAKANGQITVNVSGGSGVYRICNDYDINCHMSTSPYTFTWLAPATYTVYVSDSTCLNSRTSAVATINPGVHVDKPTSVSHNSVCEGDDLILSATGVGGTGFLWTDITNNWTGTGASSTTRSNIQLSMAGYYAVSQLLNGCASESVLDSVFVGEIPTITGVDTACYGGGDGEITIHATNNSSQLIEYQITDGVTTWPYQSSNVFGSLNNGMYTVRARSVGTTCENNVVNVEVYCPHGNKEAVATVYPNPNTGSFTVNLELNEGSDIVKMELFDMVGRRIYTEYTEEHSHMLRRNLSISHLEAGTYTLKVSVGKDDTYLVPISVTTK